MNTEPQIYKTCEMPNKINIYRGWQQKKGKKVKKKWNLLVVITDNLVFRLRIRTHLLIGTV